MRGNRPDATQRVGYNDWRKQEDQAVWKSIVSKMPAWKAATLGAVLGLAMIPYPAYAAPGAAVTPCRASTMRCSARCRMAGRLGKAGVLRNWSRSFAGPSTSPR